MLKIERNPNFLEKLNERKITRNVWYSSKYVLFDNKLKEHRLQFKTHLCTGF